MRTAPKCAKRKSLNRHRLIATPPRPYGTWKQQHEPVPAHDPAPQESELNRALYRIRHTNSVLPHSPASSWALCAASISCCVRRIGPGGMRLEQHHAHDTVAEPGSGARTDTRTRPNSCARAHTGTSGTK